VKISSSPQSQWQGGGEGSGGGGEGGSGGSNKWIDGHMCDLCQKEKQSLLGLESSLCLEEKYQYPWVKSQVTFIFLMLGLSHLLIHSRNKQRDLSSMILDCLSGGSSQEWESRKKNQVCLTVLGFELQTLYLLSMHSTT
jgi:hypothetical protein